jgi:hypothetical protein
MEDKSKKQQKKETNGHSTPEGQDHKDPLARAKEEKVKSILHWRGAKNSKQSSKPTKGKTTPVLHIRWAPTPNPEPRQPFKHTIEESKKMASSDAGGMGISEWKLKRDVLRSFEMEVDPFRDTLRSNTAMVTAKGRYMRWLVQGMLEQVTIPMLVDVKTFKGERVLKLESALTGSIKVQTLRWVLSMLTKRTSDLPPVAMLDDLLVNYPDARDMFDMESWKETTDIWDNARRRYLVNNVFIPVIRAYGRMTEGAYKDVTMGFEDYISVLELVDRIEEMKDSVFTSDQSLAILHSIEMYKLSLTGPATEFVSLMLDMSMSNAGNKHTDTVELPMYKAVTLYALLAEDLDQDVLSDAVTKLLDSNIDFSFECPLGTLTRDTLVRDIMGIPALVDYTWDLSANAAGDPFITLMSHFCSDLLQYAEQDLTVDSIVKTIMEQLDGVKTREAKDGLHKMFLSGWFNDILKYNNAPTTAAASMMCDQIALTATPHVIETIMQRRLVSAASMLASIAAPARIEVSPDALPILSILMTIRRVFVARLTKTLAYAMAPYHKNMVVEILGGSKPLADTVLHSVTAKGVLEEAANIATITSPYTSAFIERVGEGTNAFMIGDPTSSVKVMRVYVNPDLYKYKHDVSIDHCMAHKLTNNLFLKLHYVAVVKTGAYVGLLSPDQLVDVNIKDIIQYCTPKTVTQDWLDEHVSVTAYEMLPPIGKDFPEFLCFQLPGVISRHNFSLHPTDYCPLDLREFRVPLDEVQAAVESALSGLDLVPGETVHYVTSDAGYVKIVEELPLEIEQHHPIPSTSAVVFREPRIMTEATQPDSMVKLITALSSQLAIASRDDQGSGDAENASGSSGAHSGAPTDILDDGDGDA